MDSGTTPSLPNREKMTLPPVLAKIPWHKRVTTRIFFLVFSASVSGVSGTGLPGNPHGRPERQKSPFPGTASS